MNYFGLTAATNAFNPWELEAFGHLYTAPGLSVSQAASIDTKLDDGMPTAGSVVAAYPTLNVPYYGNAPNAATPSSTTCYDTTSNMYSVTQSGGANVNCGLSFIMQAGDR